MIDVLVDHNIEGQAVLLWNTLQTEGWQAIVPMRLLRFTDVHIDHDSSDRLVWHTAQAQGMLLLTANRNMDNVDSLEETIRDDNQPTSLPVITIGDADRMVEASYRVQCATRLAEIVIYLDDYLGSGRLFIP